MGSFDASYWWGLWPLVLLAVTGAVGGLVAHRFTIGGKEKRLADGVASEASVWSSMLLGAVVPILAWASSEQSSTITLVQVPDELSGQTVGDLVTAVTLGLGGTGWFTNWSKRRVTQLLGVEAAAQPENPEAARHLAAGNSLLAARALSTPPSPDPADGTHAPS